MLMWRRAAATDAARRGRAARRNITSSATEDLLCRARHNSSIFTMHRVIDGLNADVLHSPFGLAPLFGRTPLVLTAHDLMRLRAPARARA